MPAKTAIYHTKAHPGFKAIASRISRTRHVSMARASAILASAARRASYSARRKNPRLNRVHGNVKWCR